MKMPAHSCRSFRLIPAAASEANFLLDNESCVKSAIKFACLLALPDLERKILEGLSTLSVSHRYRYRDLSLDTLWH